MSAKEIGARNFVKGRRYTLGNSEVTTTVLRRIRSPCNAHGGPHHPALWGWPAGNNGLLSRDNNMPTRNEGESKR